jgi:hypothetical protein
MTKQDKKLSQSISSKFKHMFLNIFVDLQTTLPEQAHLAEGQTGAAGEERNITMFGAGTRTQTPSRTEAHLAEGQRLEERLNIETLRMSRAGTRTPTVSRTEAHLAEG